ncbi:ParB N-terminal domain-containing protein [Rhizobium leguminosarum]|uniref:plasmid partitioning protein RepB C-terminal domain-containing protein n=1 Tax=Rhizobium TaxID=379 RepID=UPI001C9466AD|nr:MULTISPECIES: plasmid partitioning protein RepB C-terminal domain-containing protein [Rhizobium]MBY5565945.1 ParB N-terminal domain-containing protein [Rhizobium leguminosarum]MBY5573075.1 ParB N-terminal domain-containing protein [Rhizobium leguminosarum]UFW64445.1 chromosome partitioning protein ParB [Rhizobium laguerreae]
MKSSVAASSVPLSFENMSLRIPIAEILPLKQLSSAALKSVKYAQIAASIDEVGIIEPPVVIRDSQQHDKFHLLDGHIRVDVLAKRGDTEVVCLVATEDEAYTYNRRISRLATIQEHKMILKAIEKGVPEERLARALNVNISSIRHKKSLLEGICPEAIDLLKEKHVPINTIGELRKMKPMRQIEAAGLMIAMNKFSVSYAKSLVVATSDSMLVSPKKKIAGLSEDQISLMEQEAASLDREFKTIEHDYGADHLDVVLAVGYVTRIMANARVVRHLAQFYPDILSEFTKMITVRRAA